MIDKRIVDAKRVVGTKWRRLRAQGVLIWIAAVLAGLLIETLMKTRPPLLLAGVSLVFLFFLAFLERPDLGLFFVLVARSVSDLSVAGGRANELGNVALMQPNVGLSVIVIVGGALFILSHRAPFLSLPGGTILVLLLLTGTVAMLRTESLLYSLYHWLRVVTVLFPYALAAYLFNTRQRVLRVVDVFAISFVIPALYGLYQFVTGNGYVQEGVGLRVQGTFVHPNAFGIYLVVFLAVFFCQARVQSGIRKLVAMAIVVAAAFLIAMTYARVAWIGAMVVMVTVGTLVKRPAVLLLPVLGFVALNSIPALSHRAADLSTILLPGGGGSLQARYGIWEALYSDWKAVTDVPGSGLATAMNRLAGTGPGSAGYHTARGGQGELTAPHNDYMAVLSDYGFFGLSMYLLMFGVLILFAFRTWKATGDTVMRAIPLSFLALLLAILAMSLTDNLFEATQSQLFLWTLAGLTVAVKRMSLEGSSVEAERDRDLRSQHRIPAVRGEGPRRLSPRRGLAVR